MNNFEEIRRQQELQKANILRGFGVNPESKDLELEIFKAQETEFEKAKHQDGDMHPNGKWVWVASANGGKGDWRTLGGRAHKKHQAGASASSSSTSNGASTSQATQTSQAKPAKKETTVDTLKLESKNGFKFKSDSNYRMRYNKREKAYEIWKEGDVYGTKTAIMSIKSDNENIGGDIIKHIQKKYPKKGSTISYLAGTYGF